MKNKLQKARRDKGLSQEQMADQIGMAQSCYCRREKGLLSISDIEWDKIATVLELKKEAIYEEGSKKKAFSIINSSLFHDIIIPEIVLEYIKLLKIENNKLKKELKKYKS